MSNFAIVFFFFKIIEPCGEIKCLVKRQKLCVVCEKKCTVHLVIVMSADVSVLVTEKVSFFPECNSKI